MVILTIIICLIICCIVGYVGYHTGHNKHIQEVQFNIKEQRHQYELAIKSVQEQQRKIADLQKEYNDKCALISQARTKAEEEYKSHFALLEERYQANQITLINQYKQRQKELDAQYQESMQKFQEEKDKISAELSQLSQTKAATIQALQREEALQKEKDSYRLNISQTDLSDVEILESVRPKLNNPRILSMLIWKTYWQPLAKKQFPLILGKDEVTGIYKITNLKNQKVYIGQARNIRERFNQHCKCGLGIDTPQGNKLYQDMLKDGLENFTFELLEECVPELLNEKEQFYIDTFSSVEYGYNSRRQI